MIYTNKISDIKEDFTRNTLSELVSRLELIIQLEKAPAFIMGYCATTNEIYNAVVAYLKEELDLASELSVELSRDLCSLKDYFKEHISELNNLSGDVVLVTARGFERLRDLEFATRVAHDYDQEIIERREEKFKGLAKKVVVVTHIGYSEGQERYTQAVISASASQFCHFLWKIEPK